MGKKKRRPMSKKLRLQLAGLAVLAVAAFAVVAMALTKQAPTAAPVIRPAVTSTPSATATTVPPKVAFMGDSYTAGTGSTSKNTRWTTMLSTQLGWEEMNFGQGGSGFTGGGGPGSDGQERLSYPDMIPAVVAAQPDMVVVATAGNDFNRGPEFFKPAAAEFFKTLRAGLPKAKIIVVSPMWRGPEPHEQLPALTQSLKDGAASVKGTYLDIGSDFQTSLADGLLGNDDIHPNDKGHAKLAAEVAAAYKAATPAK